ncbi:MAG: hypothetical protein LC687_03885 [Actinobacteria bacterium]|nr:hypothetical protein [Actinomycetota bacterium]
MADQDFQPQDETLFDDLTEQPEAAFLGLLIEDLFLDNGIGVVFKEFAAVIADVFENASGDSYESITADLIPEMRSHLHQVFKDMELGDDMMITKSSDKELRVAISRALRAVGDAIA